MASNAPLKVILFLGSVRPGRLCERVAKFIHKKLLEKNYDVEIFDPLVMQLPILQRAIHHYPPDRSGAPAELIEAEKKMIAADAFVVICGEYNHSIPPALSNIMSHFGSSSYSFKPSAMVCYSAGPYGGMRAAMQLRSFLGELGCLSVSNIMGVPEAQNALKEDGTPTGQNAHLDSSAKRLLDQLDWMAHAMRNHRALVGTPN